MILMEKAKLKEVDAFHMQTAQLNQRLQIAEKENVSSSERLIVRN